MIHSSLPHLRALLPALWLGAAFAASPALVWAQQNTAGPTAEEAQAAPALPVGEATNQLLALQRNGRQASPTPRPIAGDVASLSYQRYLDSFKHPIPEHFSTNVKTSGSSAQ